MIDDFTEAYLHEDPRWIWTEPDPRARAVQECVDRTRLDDLRSGLPGDDGSADDGSAGAQRADDLHRLCPLVASPGDRS